MWEIEQSSYSAMLNIAESVPPPEPVPSNYGNPILIQYNRPTRHWPSSVNSRSSQNLIQTEFRNSIRFQNCMEFREFDESRLVTSRYVILNDDRVPGIGWDWFRGRNWFRNVQHRGIGCILVFHYKLKLYHGLDYKSVEYVVHFNLDFLNY
jgi:hypothetical protein